MDCQSKVGFSVIELIAVLSLMAILFAIGLPASNKLLLSYQLNSSARRVQTELQNIKMRAGAENVGFQFAYGAGSGTYNIQRDGSFRQQAATRRHTNHSSRYRFIFT
jgi:Tfp pilus assembly protein FimT